MGKRVRLTPTLIEEVWALYNRDFEESAISAKLGISRASVIRCIYAMQEASNGRFVEYTGLLRDSHHIADYANSKFQTTKSKESIQTVKTLDLIDVLQIFTSTLNQWNTLFEAILKDLEKNK
jgi:hypothetical protein